MSFLERMQELDRLARSTSGAERRRILRPKAELLLGCFDQRELAPSIAQAKSFEAAVLLKEIFDRIDLPPVDELPDDEVARKEQIARYRIPGTEIALVRVDEGIRKGEYLFSGDTIDRAADFFERVRQMPYHDDATTPGLYVLYTGMQGWMVPATWVSSLPAWARMTVHDHALWQWSCLVFLGAMGLLLVLVSYSVARRCSGWMGPVGAIVPFVFPIMWIVVAFVLDFIFSTQVRMTGQVLIALKLVLRLQLFLAGIATVLMVLNRAANLVIRSQRLRPEGIDSQLVRLGFRVLTFLVVAWLVVLGADYMGIAVAPLIAGLGVSGLAVALAAQHTIENLIAGIVLFADKPVRVGDFCRFGDTQGTVEEIGLRSTRVRGQDRTVIAIPNAEFAKLQLVNYTRRDQILLKTTLQLRYETTADQLRYVLARLRELLQAHPRVAKEPLRVRFVGYGEWSLDVELFGFVTTANWAEFLSIQEDILLQIMDVVRDAGTAFAFPSTTEYEASEGSGDPERARAAEAQVKAWREDGQLAAVGFATPEGMASPGVPRRRTDPPSTNLPHLPARIARAWGGGRTPNGTDHAGH